MNEDVLQNLDFTALLSKMTQKEFTVKFEGGQYTFKYKDLSWNKRMELANNSLDAVSQSFNIGEYYINCLLEMLDPETCPGLSRTVLMGLSPEVLDQLVSIIPNPWGSLDDIASLKKG